MLPATGQIGDRFGHPENRFAINVLNWMARRFLAREQDGAYSLKWIPRGAARLHRQWGAPLSRGRQAPASRCGLRASDRGTDICPRPLSEASTRGGRQMAQFADMVFAPPPDLIAPLRALRQNLVRADMALAAFEERILGVLASTVALSAEHRRLAERVPARRAATRRCLLSRLQRAGDYRKREPKACFRDHGENLPDRPINSL